MISCVSGGALVGAHYVMMLKQLIEVCNLALFLFSLLLLVFVDGVLCLLMLCCLQSKTDEQITKQDYIDLVAKLIQQFVEATARCVCL